MLDLSFPSLWEVDISRIFDSPRLEDGNIKAAFQNSFGTRPLKEMASRKRNIVIAVEDITRPVRLERILRTVIQELRAAGVKKKNIILIACNGAHAPMPRADLVKKIGKSIVKDFLILNHNPYDNLSETGMVLGKTPVKVNRNFYKADFKIAVGSIIPHNFAGFSSGGKLILPGLSDIATLERSHKYVMMGFRGGVNDVETNKFRLEIEEVVNRIGVDFFVGVVPNSRREIAGVFTGHIVDAHRAGVEFARKVFGTKHQTSYDIAVLNAYPKDSELLQADTALTPLKTTKAEIIKEDGVIVIISKCSNGFGYHALFGPGMRLSRKPIKRRFLKGKDLIVFAPGINQAEFRSLYWEGYTLADRWNSVISLLENRFPGRCRVSVMPCAPLQLLQCPT